MVTNKAIITLVLGVFVTLVSASAGQAETQFYFCKQTMQYDRNAKEPSGIDPVQLDFVVKDGAFSMGEVRFNGKVSISETEVTAFVDNVRYEGFVNLLHTSPTAAELTMSIMDKGEEEGLLARAGFISGDISRRVPALTSSAQAASEFGSWSRRVPAI